MAGLGDLFGEGSTASQFMLWGVGYALASAILAPVVDEIREQAYAKLQVTPISPADAADQVVRNIRTEADGANEAALSGVSPERFGLLVEGAGEPPGLEFILQAYRRGFVPFQGGDPTQPSVETGVKTGRIYDYWLPVIQKMLEIPISPADAVNAVLRGQIPLAEGQTQAYASGVSNDNFQILLDAAGRPPSPTELVEFYRRGFIPFQGVGPDVLSFQQGIYEGDTKDKWEPLYEKLADYVIPARVVTTLYRTGAIDHNQAAAYFAANGLSATQAAEYLQSVQGEKLEGTRQLAQGTVLELYQAGSMSAADATSSLGLLGYTATQAAFLLSLYDLRQEVAALNRATNRIGQLYIKRKITRDGATTALDNLGVVGEHQAKLMAVWDEQIITELPIPTAAQIGKAVYYQGITWADGLLELAKLGYQPFDAYVVLVAEAEGPQGQAPPNVPAPPAVI